MRLLYDFQAENVWFSKNGAKAYRRGEKPRFLWKDAGANLDLLEETCTHHISRLITRGSYTRELVMFYRLKEPDSVNPT